MASSCRGGGRVEDAWAGEFLTHDLDAGWGLSKAKTLLHSYL